MNRREFSQIALNSTLSYFLIDLALQTESFAKKVPRSEMMNWLLELNSYSRGLKKEKISAEEWQRKVDQIFTRLKREKLGQFINLKEIVQRLADRNDKFSGRNVRLPQYPGFTRALSVKQQVYKFPKGVAIAPHAHNNMVSAHFVLKGSFQLQTFDRVFDQATAPGTIPLMPRIDKVFKESEFITMSDHKDNVHSFKSLEEDSYIYYIVVKGVKSKYNYKDQADKNGMIYLDTTAAKKGKVFSAKKISQKEALKKFGKV